MCYLYFPVDKEEVILTYLYYGARRIVCVSGQSSLKRLGKQCLTRMDFKKMVARDNDLSQLREIGHQIVEV